MKVYSFISALFIPSVMVATGLIFHRWTPRSINTLFGYRTRRSMLNDDTWAYANRTMSRVWIRWGLLMLTSSLILMLGFLQKPVEILTRLSLVLTLIQLVLMTLSILPVEGALKARFDEKGRRKENSQ